MRLGIVHAVFHCCDCDQEWDDYNTAQELAQEHAKAFHHKVTGETATAWEYDCRY